MNDLLLLLSARGQGTWQQFRRAVEELQLGGATEEDGQFPVIQRIKLTLERLGHVEFFTSGGQWRVTPPTFAHNEARAILCGARSDALLVKLEEAGALSRPEVEGPDTITLEGDGDTLEALPKQLGIHVQPEAPTTILRSLRSLDDPRYWRAATLPSGLMWEIERFDVQELRWRRSDTAAACHQQASLLRFQAKYHWNYYFCTNGTSFETDVQAGKYLAVCGAAQVLRYDQTQQQLTVPVTMRPPLLVERALILCSGRLPLLNETEGTLAYERISPAVHALASRILAQT